MRLAIGTAQFGLNYGITNLQGKVSADDAQHILRQAREAGVTLLDTAAAYGDAEQVLGRSGSAEKFRIVTKIQPRDTVECGDLLRESARRLGVAKLNTVLLHDAPLVLERPAIWGEMVRLKRDGAMSYIGISFYYPSQWEQMIELCSHGSWPLPDVVQLPISVFDQRFVPVLADLASNGVEIHARSVYLQGAAFIGSHQLPHYLRPLKPALRLLAELEEQRGLDRTVLLMAFVLQYRQIDYMVIGIDGVNRWNETVTAYHLADKLLNNENFLHNLDFSAFTIDDESVILPFRWKGN